MFDRKFGANLLLFRKLMSILRQSLRLNAVQSSLIQTMILSVYLWVIILFLVFFHCEIENSLDASIAYAQ